MKVHANQLDRSLGETLPPLIWLSGDETLLCQEAADTVRAKCRDLGFSEREVWHVDNSMDWEALHGSANSLSLFAERKVIEVRFPGGKPGDKALKALLGYLQNPNPDTLLLVSSAKLDGSALRTKTFKQLEPNMLLVQIWPVDADRLGAWLSQRLAAKKLRASTEALQILAERTEGNLLAAQQEIDKLVLVTNGDNIDGDAMLAAVANSARYNVYELSERALTGDGAAVNRMLKGLRAEGTEAIQVLWALSRDVRRLISLRQAMDAGRSVDPVFSQERIFNRLQGPFRQAAKRLPRDLLVAALDRCRQIDSAAKGMGNDNPWRGLLDVALLLAGHPVLVSHQK